eukprot:FR737439.1.p1 GENE.FR737439.1~~FR737439.1.p1  ORF type:complete len:107 (+),score=10.60 FR737439.1:25-321(+)
MDIYPVDQIMFLEMRSLHSNVTAAISRIHAFLRLPEVKVRDGASRGATNDGKMQKVMSNVKSSTSAVMLPETEAALRRFYDPFNTALADLLNDTAFLW